MTDDLAKEIASSALGIGWLDTESAARKVAKHSADRIEELEAKLAKAVEALGLLVYLQSGAPCTGIQSEQWLSEARTTLAELTGGNDDK